MKEKALRFAPLIRVSTERQEQQGESLRTQRKYNARDIERLGGVIVQWYGGQEHATPGWEKGEVDRLIADAIKGKFDAVMVAYADRWSRDNAKSKEGLDVFRKHGIRFFVGSMEMNLFDPQHRFMLGMSAEVGEFIALQQAKKSIESRIERARQGRPTAGRMPYGRTFNDETGQWGIDPQKQEIITRIAERYLAGESMPELAKEYGWHRGNLRETLRDRCGNIWKQTFKDVDLNIDELVETTVPRLLQERTIRAIHQRLEANRTYLHGRPKYDYLLNGRIFCAGCGYAMTGQVNNQNGYAYYRHLHKDRARECPVRPRPHVPVDKIETEVIKQLFEMFGNPAAIERAVKAAVPDCDKALKQQGRIQAELAQVESARNRVLNLIERDTLTIEQAEKKLRDLKDREAGLRANLDKLAAALADVPDEETVRCYVERIEGVFGPTIVVQDEQGNTYEGGNDVQSYIMMSREDRRRLIRAVFDTPLADGKPAGVYVYPEEGEVKRYRPRKFKFKIIGRLDFELVMRDAGRLPNVPPYKPPFELAGNS